MTVLQFFLRPVVKVRAWRAICREVLDIVGDRAGAVAELELAKYSLHVMGWRTDGTVAEDIERLAMDWGDVNRSWGLERHEKDRAISRWGEAVAEREQLRRERDELLDRACRLEATLTNACEVSER